MTSSLISRLSACVLFLGGATLLFAPDVILPALVPGFPPAAAWLGQLLGASWLAVAALNWLHRSTVLGGMDVYQWFLMISMHSQRHILQIREIKGDPKYPS